MTSKVTKFIIILAISLPIALSAAQQKQNIFRFDTPWLGVEIQKVSEKILKNMGLENGVKISKVYSNSPAEKAKLEMDDIIVSFDGEKVESPADLSEQVKMKKVNDEVELKYFRNGKMNSVDVKIEKRKVPQIFNKAMPQMLKKKFKHSNNSVFLGVKVEPLTDQLREYFNVSDGLGVLVSEVLENSPAEKAGLKAGDVITKIEDREVKNYHDLVRGLNYFDPDDEVDVYFVRDKDNESVKVTLAQPKDNLKKMKWIESDDFDYDFHHNGMEDMDIFEIEVAPAELDKTIEIKKEIRNKDEA